MSKEFKKAVWITAMMFGGLMPVQATLVVSDNFDYALGATPDANNLLGSADEGWGTGWYFYNGFSGEVVSGLSFNGLGSSGNALRVSRSASSGNLLFRGLSENLAAGTYYMSFLFQRDDVNGGSSEHWSWSIRHSGTIANGPSSSARFEAGSTSAEKARVKFSADIAGTESYNMNVPILVLLKIVIDDTSGANETVSIAMFNNGDALPASDGEIVWEATASGDWGTSGRNSWSLTLPSGIEADSFTIDEFRMGTELTDVINIKRQLSLIVITSGE